MSYFESKNVFFYKFFYHYLKDPVLVKFLLNRKANVTAKDDKCQTALHHAVINTTPNTQVSQIVELLLSADACPTTADEKQQTPLHLIFCKGKISLITTVGAELKHPTSFMSYHFSLNRRFFVFGNP